MLTRLLAVSASLCLILSPLVAASDFERRTQPLLKKYCHRCHHADNRESGVRVDTLKASIPESAIKHWEVVREQIEDRFMPPEDEPQPTDEERTFLVDWLESALRDAKSRKQQYNGSVRRLTVGQYRNTLRELLIVDEEVTSILPPDAVSKEGFTNDQGSMVLSPLQIEAYFEIAEKVLGLAMVAPNSRPRIQHFRMDLGRDINSAPCPDKLILGANNHLLRNQDFVVSEPTLEKGFRFEQVTMRTRWRFHEGYEGNATVRGWRDYDNMYHSVFACMRGNHGYPTGVAYEMVPNGLLLRPAIPSAELFQVESTYGPRANFKIALRELPSNGRFRVTVRAAAYDDALLLDGKETTRQLTDNAIVVDDPLNVSSIEVSRSGIYQLDVFEQSGMNAKDAKKSKPSLRVEVAERRVSASLKQPAFLILRLEEGRCDFAMEYRGKGAVDRVVLSPLSESDPLHDRFLRFEARRPHVGVHLGLRRDCGDTMNPVGRPQRVDSKDTAEYVFEGAINNFPAPDVQQDNDNYLAGIHEIGVRCEYTDGRERPRLRIESVSFEGPFYENWPPQSHQALFDPGAGIADETRRAEAILRSFASRAYRRPAIDAEVVALMSVWRDAFAESGSFRIGIKQAMTVALTSPQFLFLIEQSESPQPERLDDFELASKLSYFLWNGPPDAELLRLAERGTLAEDLDHQVDRLIEDARFDRFIHQFASEWLSLEKLDVVEIDRGSFPRLTRDVKRFLRRQPVALLSRLIRDNLPARHLVRSDFVMANEVVADYYGLSDRCESGFEFVAIRHDQSHLGGVLSHAGILAGLSDGREANPVKRGAWLARKILADPPDDPPPNVPQLDDDTSHLPLRERLQKHRNQKGCRNCHNGIDPWGVPFEDYDAAGVFHASDESASMLPDGTMVKNSARLRDYLANEKLGQVSFSAAKHLTTFAIGRSLTFQENQALVEDVEGLASSGYPMRDMIKLIVRSDAFLMK